MTRQEFEAKVAKLRPGMIHGMDVEGMLNLLCEVVAPLLDDTPSRDHAEGADGMDVASGRGPLVPPLVFKHQLDERRAEMEPAAYTRTVTVGEGAPAKTRGQEVAEKLFFDRHDSGLLPAAWVMAIAKAVDTELAANNAAWSRALHLPPNIAWTPETGGKHVAEQMDGVAAVASAEAAKSIESFADGMEYSASQYERTGARIEAMAMRDTQRSLRNAAKHLSPSNNPPR